MMRWLFGRMPPKPETYLRAAQGDPLAMIEVEEFGREVDHTAMRSMTICVILQCVVILGLSNPYTVIGRLVLAGQLAALIYVVDRRRHVSELSRRSLEGSS